jgi:hypothetical protein
MPRPHEVQPKIDRERQVLENLKLLPEDLKIDLGSITALLDRYLTIIEEVADSVPDRSDGAGYLYRTPV